MECHPPAGPATDWPSCQQFRAITPTEAACEFFLAINHGATGVLWFTAEGMGVTAQNTSRVALITMYPALWAQLEFLARIMKNGLAAAVLAPAPQLASKFSATGSSAEGRWGVDATIHVHGSDFVIVAANPERFAVNSVVFDLSAIRIKPNATWVSNYFFCPPPGGQSCGMRTDMQLKHAAPPVRGAAPSNSFTDDFPPLAVAHYVCKDCVGV